MFDYNGKSLIKNFYLDFMLIITLLTSLGVIFFALLTFKVDDTKIRIKDAESYNEGWVYSTSKMNSEINVLTSKNVLPSDVKPSEVLCFLTNDQKVQVLVDGQTIYLYGYNDAAIRDTAFGEVYHLVEIPNDSSGKEIEIKLVSQKQNMVPIVNCDFTLDDRGTTVLSLFISNILGIFVSGLILVSGLEILSSASLSFNRKERFRNQLFLGIFIVSAAIWFSTGTLIFQLLFKNLFVKYLLSEFSLMLMPFSFLLFAREQFNKFKRPITLFAIISWIYFSIKTILYFWGIVSFYQYIYITHLIIIVSIILMIIICFNERKTKEAQNLLTGMVLLSFFSFLALGSYYQKGLNSNSSDYIKLFYYGMIIFIVILLYDSNKRRQGIRKKAMQSEFYRQSAYIDVMTKTNSRTAFREDIEEIEKNISSYELIACIMFDLNNLKQVNDFYGHAAGDALLCNLANCLKEAFENFGKVYRIGGDEFVVIFLNVNKKDVEKSLKCFWEKVESLNNEYFSERYIAFGLAYRHAKENKGVKADELIQLADALMYTDKKQKKLKNIKEAMERSQNAKTPEDEEDI